MGKVKVSKEVFEALESTKEWDVDGYKGINFKKGLIRLKLDDGFQGNRQCLNLMDFEEFMDCLFNGYELEETKEQRLVERFKLYSKEDGVFNSSSYVAGRKTGILECLEILQIKIKGINA